MESDRDDQITRHGSHSVTAAYSTRCFEHAHHGIHERHVVDEMQRRGADHNIGVGGRAVSESHLDAIRVLGQADANTRITHPSSRNSIAQISHTSPVWNAERVLLNKAP